MDPVWGGLYQYSVGGTWDTPHYEKLATIQAYNLEAYARAFALTGRADFRADIDAIAAYVRRFLTSPSGAFYANQDADLGSHDPATPFVEGADYYSLNERERLAAGVPWIDERISGFENGLLIAALVAAHEATGDAALLSLATRAADSVIASRVDASGAVFRDSGAQGVFAQRRRPFVHNVLAARFLADLARATRDETYRLRARRTLAAIATPGALAAQGRMLGAFLMAVEETH